MTKVTDVSDDRLIAKYVEGDNEAFDALIERHKNRIFNYILHSVKDVDLANDIFQETFVKAIMTIKQGRYVENGHFPAWITRIAHNLIIDFFRQEKSENVQSSDSCEVDILNHVRRLVTALPDNQREVLLMRYYKNMSFKEIADHTHVSINTALGRMRYAILNMRRMAIENNIVLTV